MFKHDHYVPILRWKRAEWVALKNLSELDKKRITPLIEIVPKDFKDNKKNIEKNPIDVVAQKAIDIKDNWGSEPFFMDVWLLRGRVESANTDKLLAELYKKSIELGLTLIPVINLSSYHEHLNTVLKYNSIKNNGVCLRIFCENISDPNFFNVLNRLVSLLNIPAKNIDLLFDYQANLNPEENIEHIYNKIPLWGTWRTLTLIGGAFPKDLTSFSVGQHTLNRSDLFYWKKQFQTWPKNVRKPAFGDYTIQHPYFSEPPSFPNFSASIRYTCENYWVIMRGEGVRNDDGPGFSQWPANAQLLCARNEFCGSRFCYGDEYIEEMSCQTKKTGSAETWLRAGINHHLAFTSRQVANWHVT